MTTHTLLMDSPVGPLRLSSDGAALTEVKFEEQSRPEFDAPQPPDAAVDPLLLNAKRQLVAYFAGEGDHFDLPLAPRGTAFQRRVWEQLSLIPYGGTASYGQIAGRLGMPPGGSRAVGLANGANPIAIVVPCHRVIGADGTLTGYAGGVQRKQYLLDLESTRAAQGSLFG